MSPTDEDRQLIDAILAGDSRAWDQIVQRFSGMVWRILRRFRLPEDDATDAFQEIFLALQKDDFHRIRQWRGKAPLDAYMVVVVRRLASDFLRAKRPEGAGDPPEVVDPDPTSEEAAMLVERRRAVQACRERLASRDQELLNLRFDLECQYREIAKRLKMTISSVGVALSRAEERVGRCLRERYPDLFSDWSGGSSVAV